VTQAERDTKHPPVADDDPLVISDGALPDKDAWQCLMSNRMRRRDVFAYLTAKFCEVYCPPRGASLYIDGGREDPAAPPVRVWTDADGVKHVDDVPQYANRIGEADVCVPFWVDRLGHGRCVLIESIDTDFIPIFALWHAARLETGTRVYIHLNAVREEGSREYMSDYVDVRALHDAVVAWHRETDTPRPLENLALALMPGNDFISNFKGIGVRYVWQGWQMHRRRIGSLVDGHGHVDPNAMRQWIDAIYKEKGGKRLHPPSAGEVRARALRMWWNLCYWRDAWRPGDAPPVPDCLQTGWRLVAPNAMPRPSNVRRVDTLDVWSAPRMHKVPGPPDGPPVLDEPGVGVGAASRTLDVLRQGPRGRAGRRGQPETGGPSADPMEVEPEHAPAAPEPAPAPEPRVAPSVHALRNVREARADGFGGAVVVYADDHELMNAGVWSAAGLPPGAAHFTLCQRDAMLECAISSARAMRLDVRVYCIEAESVREGVGKRWGVRSM
jgi:hypothetical protein